MSLLLRPGFARFAATCLVLALGGGSGSTPVRAQEAGPGSDAVRVRPQVSLGLTLGGLRTETAGVREPDLVTTVDDWDGLAPGLVLGVSWRSFELSTRVSHAEGTLHGTIVEARGLPVDAPFRASFDQWSLDESAAWRFRAGRAVRPLVLGGVGVRRRATDAEEFERSSGTRLVLHAAVGVDLSAGRRLAVRPELRWRTVEGGTSEWELGVGVSWRLGRR